VERGSYPNLAEAGIEHHRLDISDDQGRLVSVFDGARAVFHTAAKVDMWGPYEDFYRANVLGTQAVLKACRGAGVPTLIYTSSPSVIADGSDLCGINESYSYPKSYLAFYPATKAIAEREVLDHNGHGLHTLSLRPHLIWGPGDTNLIPTVIERARLGKLIRIGKGDNLVDFTYIDECVDAHLCALSAAEANPEARGKAYFISQGDPVPLWWWVGEILSKAGLPPITRSIPRRIAELLAGVFEAYSKLSGGTREPLLTRFLVKEMATSHYFDITRARTLLEYNPKFSTRERLKDFQIL
jgi:nucleoside-diphosphate-sugar epimerase